VTSSDGQHKHEYDPRFKVCLTITDAPDQNKTITNYIVNMSTGGMFIETPELVPVNTLLKVELMLPGSTPITCMGRVAWTNGPHTLKKQSLPYGMGIQFLTPLAR
jgi:Tfp pilus assembly protein PilZ